LLDSSCCPGWDVEQSCRSIWWRKLGLSISQSYGVWS
jgi:hypothetical protein